MSSAVKLPPLRVIWSCDGCQLELERRTIRIEKGYPVEPGGWAWFKGRLMCTSCKKNFHFDESRRARKK